MDRRRREVRRCGRRLDEPGFRRRHLRQPSDRPRSRRSTVFGPDDDELGGCRRGRARHCRGLRHRSGRHDRGRPRRSAPLGRPRPGFVRVRRSDTRWRGRRHRRHRRSRPRRKGSGRRKHRGIESGTPRGATRPPRSIGDSPRRHHIATGQLRYDWIDPDEVAALAVQLGAFSSVIAPPHAGFVAAASGCDGPLPVDGGQFELEVCRPERPREEPEERRVAEQAPGSTYQPSALPPTLPPSALQIAMLFA